MNLKMENASRFCIQRGNVYYVTHVTDPAKLTETEGVYWVPLDGGDPVPIAEVQGNAFSRSIRMAILYMVGVVWRM